jgi:nicotinate dehydrogenase subunit B
VIEVAEALAKVTGPRTLTEATTNIYGAQLTRRGFLKTGGRLAVGFSLIRSGVARAQAANNTTARAFDATLVETWIEIHPDNTVSFRTGKSDFGQGTVYTAYRQIVAEELDIPFESITIVFTGDTDTTPEGGGTFDLLGRGDPNIKKAAAYTRQALMQLASEKFAVPKEQLTVENGVVSVTVENGIVPNVGKSIKYGDLVKGQNLKLTIPVVGELTSIFGLNVTGNPPMKPVSSYKVVGKSFKNSIIPAKVTGKELWVTNVKLPGMLHARVIHPATVGSTLVTAGKVDKQTYPNAQVVVKGNLVAVVSPTEWEAVQAAVQVAGQTKWSEWKSLPLQAKLYEHLRNESDWKSAPVSKGRKNTGDTAAALQSATKTLTATYQMPFLKHAPIGPTMALADYRPDGTVIVHGHTQNAQALRGQIAMMLGTTVDKVIIKTYAGAGHYGRSNGGNAGAEDEAVILSRELGKPVRVQWMRNDDMQWSTQSAAAFSDVKIGLDANNRISSYQIEHYMPAMQDDRLIGAVLAGLPTMPAPSEKGEVLNNTANGSFDAWMYDAVPNLTELCYGTYQVGQKASPLAVGLRDHSMRTPGQYQQNYPRELAINDAAALAGADPIQFRLDHAKDERMMNTLRRLREEHAWESRPSPQPKATSTGSTPIRGQGVSVLLRSNTYWACACQIAVTPDTGTIKVERLTVVADPGIVINPEQLKRQVEGGAMMGVSIALHEEVAFNESGVTAENWSSYPILTMNEIPDVKIVLIHNPEVGIYGQGSEAPNALASPAIAAAFFDATGKHIRKLPLRPEYAKQILKA